MADLPPVLQKHKQEIDSVAAGRGDSIMMEFFSYMYRNQDTVRVGSTVSYNIKCDDGHFFPIVKYINENSNGLFQCRLSDNDKKSSTALIKCQIMKPFV